MECQHNSWIVHYLCESWFSRGERSPLSLCKNVLSKQTGDREKKGFQQGPLNNVFQYMMHSKSLLVIHLFIMRVRKVCLLSNKTNNGNHWAGKVPFNILQSHVRNTNLPLNICICLTNGFMLQAKVTSHKFVCIGSFLHSTVVFCRVKILRTVKSWKASPHWITSACTTWNSRTDYRSR